MEEKCRTSEGRKRIGKAAAGHTEKDIIMKNGVKGELRVYRWDREKQKTNAEYLP